MTDHRDGRPLKLTKDLTEIDGKNNVAVTTCAITTGDFEGHRYVLILGADPK